MAVRLSAVGAKVWLLHLKSSSNRSFSVNVIREICSYFKDLLVFQVTPDFIRSFSCSTFTWGPQVSLCTHIQTDQFAKWVVLKDGRIFCSGGGNY